MKVTGIDNPEKQKKAFWDTINNPNKVSNNLLNDNDFNEIVLEDGKTVFLIHVPKARLELRPVYINNDLYKGSFKRNHEGDYHCTKEEISSMMRDAYIHSYDSKILEQYDLSCLNAESVKTYKRYHEVYRPNHPWLKLDNDSYLTMIGAAAISKDTGKAHPTLAGILMFSEEPTITRISSDYFLDYRENLDPEHIRWTDRIQSSSGEWSGNVFDFFMSVSRKIVADFKVPFKLNGMVRVDNTPLHDAAREALVNCLANADYFGRCGIVIKKNRDSIVYENPGSIRVGKNQMMQGGISDPRNKTIMKMFNLLGFGEKAGSGFPLIKQACIESGLPAPTIEENIEFDRTIVIIKLGSDIDKKISTSGNSSGNSSGNEKYQNEMIRKENIIKYISKKGETTTKDIASILGLSQVRVRYILNKLCEEGIIIPIGSDKNRRYKLK